MKLDKKGRPKFDRVTLETGADLYELFKDRLQELSEHYQSGETQSPAYHLCWSLACDFIPNFDLRKQSGRKPTRDRIGGPALVRAVNAMLERDGCTIQEACERLVRQPSPYKGKKARTLASRYSDYKHLFDKASDAFVCPSCDHHFKLTDDGYENDDKN